MSFLTKFESVWQKFFHEAPKVEHTVAVVINFAAPLAVAAISAFAPEVLPFAAPIIAEIKVGIATAGAIIGDGSVTPTLTSTLQNVADNFGQLLSLAQVKDPAAYAKINANAQLVISELQAVIGFLPSVTSQPATPVTGV